MLTLHASMASTASTASMTSRARTPRKSGWRKRARPILVRASRAVALYLLWLTHQLCSPSSHARADGEQLMPGGALAVGRGGATAARPLDNFAMLHNPAGLVDLPGNQFSWGFDTSFDSLCVQPYGYYGWGIYPEMDRNGAVDNPDNLRSEFGDPLSAEYGRRRLDSVCNSGAIAPLPHLAVSYHLTPKWSFGFGFVANAFVASAQWGGKDGTIQTDAGPRPTPTRYQYVYQELPFALNPTASVAYRLTPWLSLGMTLQVAMGAVDSYVIMALRAGTSPANDLTAKLHTEDYFMPALTFAAYAKPTRRLRLAATFNWSDGLDGRGQLTLTTNTFHQGATGDELIPLENDPIQLGHVRVTQPWTAVLAARLVQPRSTSVPDDADAESAGVDPLVDERWDIELDAAYIANRTSKAGNHVDVASDFTLEFRRANGAPQMPLPVKQSQLDEINFERHTLDVLVLRLGGSYTVMPRRLQVSAGGFFQTRGVETSYASIDNYSFRRLGVSLGVLVRLGRFDVMAGFSHIFSEDITLAPPPHEPRQNANDSVTSGFDQRIYEDGVLSARPRMDPDAPRPNEADGTAMATQSAVFESDDVRRRVVNAGHYTASFNIVSLGAVYHF